MEDFRFVLVHETTAIPLHDRFTRMQNTAATYRMQKEALAVEPEVRKINNRRYHPEYLDNKDRIKQILLQQRVSVKKRLGPRRRYPRFNFPRNNYKGGIQNTPANYFIKHGNRPIQRQSFQNNQMKHLNNMPRRSFGKKHTFYKAWEGKQNINKQILTKDVLDKELDEYMAMNKFNLDKQIEEYMKEAAGTGMDVDLSFF